MVANVTSGRGYQLPDPTNLLSEDVLRLVTAIQGVDTDIVAVLSGLSGKAAAVHVHAIADVTGLTSALAGKAAAAHTHALGDLTNVSVTGAATGHALRYSGGTWAAAPLGISDITSLASTLASMQAAITTMDDGSY